jgi:hypothetical protein
LEVRTILQSAAESGGKVRVYWGTESQGVDPILAGDGVGHPAYRGQAYLVFKKLFFGENRTNAADHITLVADNFEVLSEELLKVTPTYQNGEEDY